MSTSNLDKAVRINVTARDIARGKPQNAECCPVALAARRKFKTRVRASYKLLVDQGGVWMVPYTLPERALDFIGAFDEGLPVRPFSFTVKERQAVGFQ
jgi:hypothetical protein